MITCRLCALDGIANIAIQAKCGAQQLAANQTEAWPATHRSH